MATRVNDYDAVIIGADVIALAERIGAFVATTSRAKGVVPETHELAVGVMGSIGAPCAAKAAQASDLLIILGSGFRQRNLVPDVPAVQVDWNAARIGKTFEVEAGAVGDVREALPIKVILFNDRRLKNIAKEQAIAGFPPYGVEFPNPNFAEYAASAGGLGVRVEDPDDFAPAVKKALKEKSRPSLIEVIVDPAAMAAPAGVALAARKISE